MKNIKQNKLSNALKLAILSSSLGLTSFAGAVSFNKGEFSASWDTTVSYGVAVRVEERDDSLVGKANLNELVGSNIEEGRPSTVQERAAAPGRWSINSDNGNLNYDKGDKISNALKLTTEFDLAIKVLVDSSEEHRFMILPMIQKKVYLKLPENLLGIKLVC